MKKQHLINFYHKLKTLMSLFAGLCLKAGAYLGDKLEIALEMVEDYFIEESNNLNAGFGKAHKLIGKHKQGFVVDGKRSLSLKESENNMMVIAPSGGGKSSVIIYPTICKLQHSMLVNDNSGELSDCECYLKHYGFKVGYLDFGDLTKSWYYNPLKR
ncbi:MAG: type IV secretory system conjugative DNA transfer family protein, partial [Flavobacteriales bacterium]